MKNIIALICCSMLCIGVKAEDYDELVIEISKGVFEPLRISMPRCAYQGSYVNVDKYLRKNVACILSRTKLLAFVDPKHFTESFQGINDFDNKKPTFSVWRDTDNSHLLLHGDMRLQDGAHLIRLKLYDVYNEKLLGQFEDKIMSRRDLNSNVAENKRINILARAASDFVYQGVYGESGYCNSKIAFVRKKRVKNLEQHENAYEIHQLMIADYDGRNAQVLSDGKRYMHSPVFSPDGQKIMYFGYENVICKKQMKRVNGSIYIYDLKTKEESIVVDLNKVKINDQFVVGKMAYAPRFHPNGEEIVFSMAVNGSSAIYSCNLRTREIKKITRGYKIDTSPCYSPDGKKIVFTSDQAGSSQLYIMNADGSGVTKRLSSGIGRYAAPVWSPRGDWIAFMRFGYHGFYIGIIRPDGSGEKIIASGYLVEAPTFSPNGRVILYTYQSASGSKTQLRSIDIVGGEQTIRAVYSEPGYDILCPTWSKNYPYPSEIQMVFNEKSVRNIADLGKRQDLDTTWMNNIMRKTESANRSADR